METKVPILDLQREYNYMKAAIDTRLSVALEHQAWILGPEVTEFEDALAEYIGVTHAIGTSSGTEALLIALRACSIVDFNKELFEAGDEVITTAFSFAATADTILRAGATPVILDIEEDSFNLDPGMVADYLTRSNTVRAVVPVHLYGRPINWTRLSDAVENQNLAIIEDAAQACGATWQGARCGSLGAMGAFSFFPSKNLGAFGDAGAVTCKDPKYANILRMLIKHGGKDKYNVEHLGYNARLDTLQAAILLAKLEFLDEFNNKRRSIASFYSEHLNDINELVCPIQPPEGHAFHQYTLRVKDGQRNLLQEHLQQRGIASMVYYPVPLDQMLLFKRKANIPWKCTRAHRASEEVLSLPIEPLLTEDELHVIVSTIRSYFLSK